MMACLVFMTQGVAVADDEDPQSGGTVATSPALVGASVAEFDEFGDLTVVHDTSAVTLDVTPPVTRESTSAWKVRWKIQVRYYTNGTKMRYDYAQTTRLEGAGAYADEAHGTLIKGHDFGGTQVWSAFTHACAATGKVVNATAQTCASPYQATSHGGKWLLVSGHYYDHGNNGSHDGTCHGCIDWKWTVP